MSFKIACLSILMMGSALQAMDVKSPNVSPLDAQLIDAAHKKNEQLVEQLLAKGADVNAKDKHGATALITAARSGYDKICKSLITHKADVNALDKYDSTALMDAARWGHKTTCALLIDHGAIVDARSKNGSTALLDACPNGQLSKEMIELLVASGADVNAHKNDGLTALMIAACNGRNEICEFLVACGADVNAQNDVGFTALTFVACRHYREKCEHYKQIAELLLAHGADINVQTKNGETFLMLDFVDAYQNGFKQADKEMSRWFMSKMIQPTKEEIDSMTALLGSIKKRRTDLARLIGGPDAVRLINQASEKLIHEIKQQNMQKIKDSIKKIKIDGYASESNESVRRELLVYLNSL